MLSWFLWKGGSEAVKLDLEVQLLDKRSERESNQCDNEILIKYDPFALMSQKSGNVFNHQAHEGKWLKGKDQIKDTKIIEWMPS
jgi:hypothetical protein